MAAGGVTIDKYAVTFRCLRRDPLGRTQTYSKRVTTYAENERQAVAFCHARLGDRQYASTILDCRLAVDEGVGAM